MIRKKLPTLAWRLGPILPVPTPGVWTVPVRYEATVERSPRPQVHPGPVRTMFERIAGPAAAPAAAAQPGPDLEVIGRALAELAKDVDYLSGWVNRLGDVSGLLRIHAPERGPRLQIVHRLEGQMGALHDHRTWVAAAAIVGLETHRRYRIVGSGEAAHPELAEELELDPADHVTMLPPDDFHSHGHVAGHGSPAYVLILTGDDQTLFERTEWDLATGHHRILKPGDRGRWLDSEPMPPA